SRPASYQNRRDFRANKGCLLSHGSHAGSVVRGTCDCTEATTLCAEGSTGAGQCTTTGTFTQTSTGTCRQIVRGSHTVRHSVALRVTVTGQQTVVVTGIWRQTV